ncbi:GNAT family N-acetyltransferase [Phenylobacterium sp.]|uniref:GNAT family N-acetyltransferase n=1 Tax=Phenylobacterium sp. TaxID=1871053 RepID=UPI0025CD4746|nr:GNAT family N-acetyltransferase [Phenylobacterium sp.]
MPRLVRPAMAFMPSYVEALREGYTRDPLQPETPPIIDQIERQAEWFVRLLAQPPHHVVLSDGSLGERTPETELWYVEGETFLGSISVRPKLDEALEAWGGHVGYTVRPSARGQGHASAMLAAMLDHIGETLPLDRVTLTVHLDNPASMRVIEKNGGAVRDEVDHPWIEGLRGRRYWIALR